MNLNIPFIIQFPKIGQSSLGYISIAEKENLPFIPQRVYWTYFTPEEVERGGHSHYNLQQILIAVSGKIIITTELKNGKKQEFILDSPDKGLYIPKMCWRTMKYTHNSVQICIASIEYDPEDYIRNYDDFKKTNFLNEKL
jgi:hypothetical protein